MNRDEFIPKSEAKEQVRKMASMMASLYYHFCRSIIDTLGKEKGEELIKKAIDAYGCEKGTKHRLFFEANGLPISPVTYTLQSDLPQLGWDVMIPEERINPTHIIIKNCPLAEYWKEKNFTEVGQLYCRVDQAKYKAFHPDSNFKHLKNTLNNEPYCEMVCLDEK